MLVMQVPVEVTRPGYFQGKAAEHHVSYRLTVVNGWAWTPTRESVWIADKPWKGN